eukprot:TRINITY_DN551_c0_g1_i2.p1 TRINITY_DN551_c0_g1~~TRINITY_DN551_c0_g1_i2.p1  ORF type:complete len:976 (-),score=210.56 TRINITY_DN551_c0_g1_i2:413-3340(-)
MGQSLSSEELPPEVPAAEAAASSSSASVPHEDQHQGVETPSASQTADVVDVQIESVAQTAHVPLENVTASNADAMARERAATNADPAESSKPEKKQRKRAPPSGRNLDPGMACPLPCSPLDVQSASSELGLCGPSELQSMQRSRRTRAEPLMKEVKLPLMPGPLTTVEVLRTKLRYLTTSVGASLLKPKAGRLDIAEYIFSFLDEGRPLVNTKTGGLMYSDSGSANVDLFFQSVPQESPKDNESLRVLLSAAWEESPEACLRQIFQLGAKKKGKQDRYSFYDAMLWLWHEQPATLLANLHLVPEANYWKGLLELLARICEGPLRSLERDRALHFAHMKKVPKLAMKDATGSKSCPDELGWKPGSRLELAAEALKRYDKDPIYRALFERIGQLFAEQLRADIAAMRAKRRITLCAKWCPLLYHSFDRRTLICESIARWLFPASLPEFEGTTERQYAYRARDKLRKVLSELKEYDKCPERLMCQQRWAEIQYKRVPATAMKIHTPIFQKHDTERFESYVSDLASGKAKAKTGALQPYELLKGVHSEVTVEKQVAQAQWEELVRKTKAEGKNSDIIAVCDVSASMECPAIGHTTCMDVAISLSLLLAKCASGPYASKLITFDDNPTLETLPATEDLAALVQFTRQMHWGGSTNFYKTFELLENMSPPPKRVIVFSDMQFSCSGKAATTDLKKAKQRWENVLHRKLPQLIFWNLSRHRGSPALATDEGVALVSGFSAPMLSLLLDEGEVDPLLVLGKALDTLLLQKVRVVYHVQDAIACTAVPARQNSASCEEPTPFGSSSKIEEVKGDRKGKKMPWCQISKELGTLPCKESIAAFIGKKGKHVGSLRQDLHPLILQRLKVKESKLGFWLDVKTCSVAPPNLEKGTVVVTMKARLPASKLMEVVRETLEGCAPLESAIAHAKARAKHSAHLKHKRAHKYRSLKGRDKRRPPLHLLAGRKVYKIAKRKASAKHDRDRDRD